MQGEKKKSCQPSKLSTEKLSFRNEEEIKIFSDKQKLRDFITRRCYREFLKLNNVKTYESIQMTGQGKCTAIFKMF